MPAIRNLFASACLITATAAPAAITTEGDVFLSDPPSPGPVNEVAIAQQANGSLTITPPDSLTARSLTVAEGAGLLGTVDLDGGDLVVDGSARFGRRGVGELLVRNGATYTQSNGEADVGADGVGRLAVSGAGSVAELNGGLFVADDRFASFGGFGRGEVSVTAGGFLHTAGATLGSAGTAEVVIEGAGSTWQTSDAIELVGGSLTLRDGGRVVAVDQGNDAALRLGAEGRFASAVVSGPASLLHAVGDLSVGAAGDGQVLVESGADVVADTTYVGGDSRTNGSPFASGAIELTGLGTTWTTDGLVVGWEGDGAVHLSDGAVLRSRSAELYGGSLVTVDGPLSRWDDDGDLLNVRGDLRLSGGARHAAPIVEIDGSLVVTDDRTDFRFTSDLRLNGRLEIASGARVILANDNAEVTFGEFSDVILRGGSFTFDSRDNSPQPIRAEGLISGHGTIDLAVVSEQSSSLEVGPGERLTLGAWRNHGTARVDSGVLDAEFEFINDAGGVIEVSSGRIAISDQAGEDLENDGLLRFSGPDNRVEGSFDNHYNGRVEAAPGSEVRFDGPVETLGVIRAEQDSRVVFAEDFLGIRDLTGEGLLRFEGRVDLTESVFNQSDHTADFELGDSATLDLRFDPGNPLATTGDVTLSGALEIEVNQPVATGPSELTFLEGASIAGEFSSLPTPGELIGERTRFVGVEYTPTSAVLLVEGIDPADANGDGVVDQADLDAWAANLNAFRGLADANRDFRVNAADYVVIREAIHATANDPIPEPTPLALLTACVVALVSTTPPCRTLVGTA